MTHFARTPDILLSCDGPSCLALPDKAPVVFVPAKGLGEENHRHTPVRLAFPHLHYCDKCWNAHMKLDDLLTDEAKGRIEAKGRTIWPHGIKPDFDAANVIPMDVFSPEYGRYMQRIGLKTDGLGFSMHAHFGKRLSGRTGWL